MPLVIYEAMMCGRAVLAVRSEGVAAQVEHEKTGLLVEPDNGLALTAALRHLLDDVDLAAMGRAGREKVRSCHWDHIALLYLAAFKNVLGDARCGRQTDST